MKIKSFVAELDDFIASLQQAREIVAEAFGITSVELTHHEGEKKAKRTFSPEAKKRIAEGMRKSWAARRSGVPHRAIGMKNAKSAVAERASKKAASA
jgi:hypothetical protein